MYAAFGMKTFFFGGESISGYNDEGGEAATEPLLYLSKYFPQTRLFICTKETFPGGFDIFVWI